MKGEATLRADDLTVGLAHLGHALSMIRDLPPYAAEDTEKANSLACAVNVACREDFYVNVRLVADFLSIQPKRDITASEFVTDYHSPFATELRDLWLLASRHVVHLSSDRATPSEPEDVSLEGLGRVAATCTDAITHFVTAFLSPAPSPLTRLDRLSVEGAIRSLLG